MNHCHTRSRVAPIRLVMTVKAVVTQCVNPVGLGLNVAEDGSLAFDWSIGAYISYFCEVEKDEEKIKTWHMSTAVYTSMS